MTPGGICTDCDNCSWSHCRGRVLNVGRKNRRHTNSDKTGYTTLSCTDRKSHNPLLALVRFFALLRSQTRCPPEVGEDGEPMQAPPDSYSSATSHDICEKNSAKIPGAFHLFFFSQTPPTQSGGSHHLVTLGWTKWNIFSADCPTHRAALG